MKWIGQHIYDLASRFRNDVFLEDISTGTIASGAHLGLDSNNKIVKAVDGGGDLTSIVAGTGLSGDNLSGPIPELTVDASQPGITSLGTLTNLNVDNININGDTITASADLAIIATGNDITVDSDTLTITSSTADQPIVKLVNITNDDQASQIVFEKLRADDAVAQSQNLGEIWFRGQDSAQNTENYAFIVGEIDVSTSGQESGQLRLGVASHDGSDRGGLTITGGSEATEVDVAIGRGAASVTTVAGTLTMGSTAALTNAGLVAVANQSSITGLGTISSGVWNGTAIASAYLDADTAHLSSTQTFTGVKTFGVPIISDGNRTIATGDGAAIHIDTFDVTDGTTSASGTAAAYRHVSIEAPRLLATNSSVTTTDASTLYIQGPPVASTNQTITKAYALFVDAGNARFDGNIDLEGDIDVNGTLETDALTIGGAAVLAQATASAVGAVELATTAEADTGTDTARAVTPAGLKSHVDTRYAYSYMTWSASGTSSMNGSDPEWVFPNTVKGIYEEDWTKDENIIATSVGSTAFTTSRQTAVNALVIPHTGVCVGFHATGRNDDNDTTFRAGLFHYDGSTTSATNTTGIDYGATGNTHECTLRWIATANEAEASGGADSTGGHSFKGPCKLVSNVTNTFAVTAGDALMPAIMGPDASDEIFITMTIILKIPLA